MTDSLTPTNLRCNYLVNPLGLGAQPPNLSWILESAHRAQSQSAFRILAASSQERLLAGSGDLWDSGRIESPATNQIVYQGVALAPGQRCWWSVTVWDQDGQQSVAGSPACWERGLDASDWHGAWIGLEFDDQQHPQATPAPGATDNPDAALAGMLPCTYLRTTVQLRGTVRRARIYATAKGLYELRLNGRRIGDQLFTPGWTDYDRRLQYQTYDLTDLLVPGENVIGAVLATGWYAGYIGFGRRCRNYGSRPQLLLEGRIEYADGQVAVVASDSTWKGSDGPIRSADLQMGEYYDARKIRPGWDAPGFDDRAWQAVLTEPQDGVPLVGDRAEPVQVLRELAAVAITEPAPCVAIIDLGQNISGWVRLRVRGAAGDQLRLRYGEILASDGSLYTDNLRGARCTDTYILAGQGEEEYEPRFTFHGFRYVELTGYPGVPSLESVIGVAIGSNTPPAGTFTCSSELVNQLQRNIEWGQRGNFLSIPTDCPQRDERLGWLGDAQIFVRTACYNADVAAFFGKWMVDVADAQAPNGAFPDVAPRLSDLSDGAPAWGDAGIIVPWTIYQMYGDTAIVREHYASMLAWMRYLQQANPDGLRQGRLNNNFGDWLAIEEETPTDLLATAYWAYDARLMAAMARAIGKEADAARFTDLHARLSAAFLAAYLQPENCLTGDTQTAYVVALRMVSLPEGLRADLAARLVAKLEARDWHLRTGFVGVGYLCPVLTEHGYADVAYRLLLQETYPSWGYSIRQGATTIWERWDGWTEEHGFQDPAMNSFNHYSLGSVGEWLYRSVAGIDLDAKQPGFRHIMVRPRPGGGLTHAQASYRSIVGTVESAWRLDGDVLELKVTIPANTSATVCLPAPREARLIEGDGPASEASGVRLLERSPREAMFAVGSGSYRFRVETHAQ